MEQNRPSSAAPLRPSNRLAAHRCEQQKFPSSWSVSFLFIILIPFLLLILSSCSTVQSPAQRPVSAPKKNPPAAIARPLLPEGWADITSRSKHPQIIQWIVNRDYSATMVLRELRTDPQTFKHLLNDGLSVIAGISLRSKVPLDDPDYRVTRVPTSAEGRRKMWMYVYTERGLLRRVAVFIAKDRIMELELMQEQSDAPFDGLTPALLDFAAMVQDR